MITGTNASGKTTLSKELIRRFGGVAEVRSILMGRMGTAT